MSANVTDIYDSNETTESLTPKKGRRRKSKNLSSSGRSNDNKLCNQPVTRRSSRSQNRKLKDETPPKELKLFPIFLSRCTEGKRNSKGIIEAFKIKDSVCAVEDKRDEQDIPKINEADNFQENLSSKTVKKRPRNYTRKSKCTRMKTPEVLQSDCNSKNLIKVGHITSGSQSFSLPSENTETAVAPDLANIMPEVSEIVNYICIKTEQAMDCDDGVTVIGDNDLTSDVSFKFTGCNKRKKMRHNKRLKRDESVITVDDKDEKPEISFQGKNNIKSQNKILCSEKSVRNRRSTYRYGTLKEVSTEKHNIAGDSKKNSGKKAKSLPLVINNEICKSSDCCTNSPEDGKLEPNNIIGTDVSRELKVQELDLSNVSQSFLFPSENTETADFLSPTITEPEVSETVNDICIKTEQAMVCDGVTAISQNDLITSDNMSFSNTDNNSKPNGSLKLTGSNKRKRKVQNKLLHREECSITVDDSDDNTEISVRRKSLRSMGNRDKLINYSEISNKVTRTKTKQKQKPISRKSLIKNSGDCNDDCVILDSSVNKYLKNSIDSCRTNNSEDKKSESVKENVKFFPIFTSNKVSNDSFRKDTISTKRRASNEEVYLENEDDCVKYQNQNLNSAKRVRNELSTDRHGALKQVSSVKHNLVGDSEKNSDKKCKTLPLVIDGKLDKNSDCSKKTENLQKDKKLLSKNVTESSINPEFNKSSISNPKCIHLPGDECKCKSNELQITSPKVTSCKKVNNLYTENIPFPVISHVNVSCDSLLDTTNKFQINDEVSDSDVILPVWNEIVGLTDAHFNQDTILRTDFDLGNKVTNNCNELLSDKTRNDNDENALWTDSLLNTVTKEKNNEITVNEIKSWLLQWKNKFCRSSETKNDNSDSESFSCGSDSDDDSVSNSIIISGAPGSGKTSLVFSLANELGFKVIEVNASSSRNGRNISHQLKEALESYHVESIRIENAFEDGITDAKKEKANELEVKGSRVNKNIKSFFEAKPQKGTGSGKKREGIAAFFQTDSCERKHCSSKPKTKNKKLDKCLSEKKSTEKNSFAIEKTTGSLKADKSSCKISSLTIILFDDADIVFEEDEGFWSTVKGFLKISKKPVIFTVSRNLSIVKTMLNSDINVFCMKSTSKESAVRKIETCCKAYLREDTNTDLEFLSSHNVNDLRRNVLNAQFWTKCPKRLKEGKIFDIKNCNTYFTKSIQFNSFITGELIFSADHFRKLLQHHMPSYFINAIVQYQSLGYDVLYSNLYHILNVLDFMKCEKVWKTASNVKSCRNSSKSFSDAQMWKEACEIFKLKKSALQNGSSSQELFAIADAVEDFSFADTLKGASFNKFQWISISERIKMWTAGLPICSEHCLHSYEDILQIISLIHIYILRKIQSTGYIKSGSSECKSLILEHPFLHFDQEFAYNTEADLKCLSASLPPSQQLNKVALTLDYLSTIKIMCQDEELRQLNSGKRSGRFLHYFDSISFLLDKTNILSK